MYLCCVASLSSFQSEFFILQLLKNQATCRTLPDHQDIQNSLGDWA